MNFEPKEIQGEWYVGYWDPHRVGQFNAQVCCGRSESAARSTAQAMNDSARRFRRNLREERIACGVRF